MKFLALLAAALLLAACDTVSEYTPDVEFSVLGPSERPDAPEPIDEAELEKDMVMRAERMEIGRLYDGYMLTVFGQAPETGWFAPELRPRNDGAVSADGMLELDFVAASPVKNGGEAGELGTPELRRVRADYQISRRALVGLRGVRVYGREGSIQGIF